MQKTSDFDLQEERPLAIGSIELRMHVVNIETKDFKGKITANDKIDIIEMLNPEYFVLMGFYSKE